MNRPTRRRAWGAAGLVARLTLSLISSPGGWDMDDPGAVRRLVRGQLLAGVVDLDGGDVGDAG